MTVQERAEQIWAGMDANQRIGVRIGMFPAEVMTAAEREGYNGRELSLWLMAIAENDGGMIA